MRTVTGRSIAGRVNADGTPAYGGPFTSRKTGTGLYIVTFGNERLLGISANPIAGGGGAIVATSTFTNNSVLLSVGTAAGANVDGSFSFTATVIA